METKSVKATCLTVLLVFAALAASGLEKSVMAEPPDNAAVKEVVRPAALAGRGWYPGSAEKLIETVDRYLGGDPWKGGRPLALIVPHAGYTYAGPMQGATYKSLEGHRFDRVFILGVPHRARVSGVSIPMATHYETPLGKVPVDREAADRLLAVGGPFQTVPEAHREEHSIEIHLPFLQRTVENLKIVPMLVGVRGQAVHEVAEALRKELRPGDLVIASSDNTHYGSGFGYTPFPVDEHTGRKLEKLDMDAVEKMLDLDLPGYMAYKEETGITTCGYSSICVLLALLPARAKGTLVGYDTSATMSGDWSRVVSYVGIAFTGAKWGPVHVEEETPELDAHDRAFALRLARAAMEHRVNTGEDLDPELGDWVTPDRLREKRGVFVTLKIDGRLRGCIGDVFASRPLFRAVAARAVSAAIEDPRFEPVRPEELEEIRIEISVLSPHREISSPEEIVLGKHGIVLSYNGRIRSLYLPQVAPEQGWDLEQTLRSLSRKGGLAPDAWQSEKASFRVFTAQVFGEDE